MGEFYVVWKINRTDKEEQLVERTDLLPVFLLELL